MLFIKIIFWFSFFIIFYSYLGYGMFLWVYLKMVSLFKKIKSFENEIENFEPEVTLIVATFNEELTIKEKIQNSLQINYPSQKLKIFIVADGSEDDTVKIISQFPGIELFYKPGREGKAAAINRIMPYVSTPYIIFSDANTLLNPECVKEMVKHYKNPEVGAVAGEKKVIDLSNTQSTAGAGEGLYWKYESLLKKLDARFFTVVGAAGELFSIKTALYEPVEKNILLDDFIISMKICRKGYRVMYEPNAYATETPSYSLKDEQKRKIRIAAGGFQSVLLLKDLLNIFKFGKLSFQYISHRVLRWVICPVLLPVMYLSNLFIYLQTNSFLYITLLVLQTAFYLTALIGWFFSLLNIKINLLFVAYYFLFMNIAMYFGFFRFINKSQSVLWEKAKRK
jgi:poly-beta-1,6-N-acetyl-D-glucosamine synthase